MAELNDLPADSLALALSENTLNLIAKDAAQAAAAKAGVGLDALAIHVAPGEGDNLKVHASAVVHWHFVKAPAELVGELSLSSNGTLVVESLHLKSANPLVSAGIKSYEGKLVGLTIEPKTYLPEGFPRLKNVKIDGTGGVLRLTAALDA